MKRADAATVRVPAFGADHRRRRRVSRWYASSATSPTGRWAARTLAFFLTGFVCAAIVGYLAIAFLLRYLATNTLMPFVIYRVGLALVIFTVLGVQAVA